MALHCHDQNRTKVPPGLPGDDLRRYVVVRGSLAGVRTDAGRAVIEAARARPRLVRGSTPGSTAPAALGAQPVDQGVGGGAESPRAASCWSSSWPGSRHTVEADAAGDPPDPQQSVHPAGRRGTPLADLTEQTDNNDRRQAARPPPRSAAGKRSGNDLPQPAGGPRLRTKRSMGLSSYFGRGSEVPCSETVSAVDKDVLACSHEPRRGPGSSPRVARGFTDQATGG